MPRTVYAHQRDTLDAICHRVFGQTAGITEQVLELNPGIAELGPVLPQGTPVRLPDITQQPQRTKTVQLWD
ncbi:tail protein X [Litchfieldella anticariensis FP35 = DSM 16096]|uniref:Tail protein X n=1 Tax=Litchfieldella anticariensis (strain DSM 16096 / CECT 5854 / CIP 108499 / LMG 22089 / FP35) TaxID=1121939 RepID=S2L3X3_LITA3|nr:tail protein X [Halomonas anticariensis]EPC02409.1 tail protein X [Halomonas anticariensis FP35 = DSM 16096]